MTQLFYAFDENSLFVDDVNGSDANDGLTEATAKATIDAAVTLAVDGTTVFVAAGTYSTSASLFKDTADINFFFAPGAVVTGSGADPLFNDDIDAVTCNIFGHGHFTTTTGGVSVRTTSVTSRIYIECDHIDGILSAGGNINFNAYRIESLSTGTSGIIRGEARQIDAISVTGGLLEVLGARLNGAVTVGAGTVILRNVTGSTSGIFDLTSASGVAVAYTSFFTSSSATATIRNSGSGALRLVDCIIRNTSTGTALIGPATVSPGTHYGSSSGTITLSGTAAVDTLATAVLADTGTLLNRLSSTRAAGLDRILDGGALDLLVDAIKAKTDNLPAAAAGSTGGVPTLASDGTTNVNVVRANGHATIDGYSVAEILALLLAAMAGKISGSVGNTPIIRSADDAHNRIVATTNESGDRLAVSLDVSSL